MFLRHLLMKIPRRTDVKPESFPNEDRGSVAGKSVAGLRASGHVSHLRGVQIKTGGQLRVSQSLDCG